MKNWLTFAALVLVVIAMSDVSALAVPVGKP